MNIATSNTKVLMRILTTVLIVCILGLIKFNTIKTISLNKGNNLCYQFCYPSPFNPKNYILLIGGNDMRKFSPYHIMPWYDGLSDYYIWRSTKDRNELLSQGDFDEKWKFSLIN